MKYLVVVIVVVVALWIMMRSRGATRPAARAPFGDTGPQAMVQCSHCGVHLPYAEALISSGDTYCSEEHRLAGPRTN